MDFRSKFKFNFKKLRNIEVQLLHLYDLLGLNFVYRVRGGTWTRVVVEGVGRGGTFYSLEFSYVLR